jgi:hypothetical protein
LTPSAILFLSDVWPIWEDPGEVGGLNKLLCRFD